MKRRGQYALEFLMTYGWALLVIAVMVGAIYSFGWLDFRILTPEHCDFFGQVDCRNFAADASTNQVFIEVINGFNTQLVLNNATLRHANQADGLVNCRVVDGFGAPVSPPIRDVWRVGQMVQLNFTCDPSPRFASRSRLEAVVDVEFYNAATCSGPNCGYNATGTISIRTR